MSEDKYCRKCRERLTECPTCKGKGMMFKPGGFFTSSKEEPCPNCNGTGKLCARHGRDWG